MKPIATYPAREPWTPVERTFLAAALFVALVLRLWHWHAMAPHPWFDFLGLDAKYYDEWAQRLLRDGWQGKTPYFMGPLYPHLLSIVYSIFGRSLDAVRVIQVVMSTGTVALIHLLGRQYGGRKLAMISSGAAALYAPFIYYSVSILYPTLTIFLATAILLLLHEAARRRSLAWTAAAGLLLGVYALGRGNILLFAPAAFFWLISAWGDPFTPSRRRWRAGFPAGVALAVATVVAILPATIHNARTGDFAFLTTNGGLNFYIGNGPMATGGHQTPELYLDRADGSVETVVSDLQKDVECRTEAEYAVGHPLSYTEVSSFWFRETMRWIRKDPGHFVSLLAMKTVHFWSTYEIPQIEHFGYFRRYSPPIAGPILGFGVVGPLALVGLFFSLRRPGRFALPILFVVFYSASIILFFVLARYRLPVLPGLILLAGQAVIEIVDAVRARRPLPAVAILAGAVVLGVAMRANPYGVDESKGIAQILYRQGIVADALGDPREAIGHYRDALALKPEYDKAHLNLGVDLARVGDLEGAERHLRTAAEIDPQYSRAPYNLGLILEQQGRWDEARAAYARAVEIEPRYLIARVALADLAIQQNDLGVAAEQVRAVLDYDDRWETAQHDVARARAAKIAAYLDGRTALAAAGAGDCFAASETFRRAEVARLRDDVDGALGLLRTYFEDGGACAEAYRSLGEILLLQSRDLSAAADAFQRAVTADGALPGARLGLGLVSAMSGRAEDAVRWLSEEARLDPKSPAPCLELGLVYERLLNDPVRAETWFARYRERGGDPELLRGRRAYAAARRPDAS
ncbi:MAG: tetratricopeptide repeat protein [bacterium]